MKCSSDFKLINETWRQDFKKCREQMDNLSNDQVTQFMTVLGKVFQRAGINLWLLYAIESGWFDLISSVMSSGRSATFNADKLAHFITQGGVMEQENVFKILVDKVRADTDADNKQKYVRLLLCLNESSFVFRASKQHSKFVELYVESC